MPIPSQCLDLTVDSTSPLRRRWHRRQLPCGSSPSLSASHEVAAARPLPVGRRRDLFLSPVGSFPVREEVVDGWTHGVEREDGRAVGGCGEAAGEGVQRRGFAGGYGAAARGRSAAAREDGMRWRREMGCGGGGMGVRHGTRKRSARRRFGGSRVSQGS
nr:unnamed protein product [Digitaria exilis]